MNFLLLFLLVLAIGFAAAWTAERARRQRTEAAHRRELDEQRTHRESDLRAQTERTVALFDRMIEGLIVIDASGRIRLANRAAGELFGFPSPAIGRTILEATRHHEVAALAARLDREPEILGHEFPAPRDC
jgi:PAS domain-containing protein